MATAVREVLVATDFSEASQAAIRVAHRYAGAFGARLHIFHVIVPGETGITEIFAALATELGAAVPLVVASHSGDAAEEIVRYATLRGVDLIVLGSHGRTGFSRTLLGSVAERVTRTAPCPVLTVPPRMPAARQDSLVLPPYLHRCIVCHVMSRDLVCEPCRARIRGETVAGSPRDAPMA